MNMDMMLNQIKNDPGYCKFCNKITDFTFQVAQNTTKGQYTGLVCPLCNKFKRVKFTPYKTRGDYNRIWNKDYRGL